jgi:DEAD/DEAH box helicase domain-containing protein
MSITYHIPAVEGEPASIPDWVHPRIKQWSLQNSITPWSHQVAVWSAHHAGLDACITTPTGSGKSLAFTVPILETLLNTDRNVLVIFPLKALANDQAITMRSILSDFDLANLIGVIDGETRSGTRVQFLQNKRVLMTNPYILHANMHKPEWRAWLANMSLVVVDEIHTYTGVFGSEMAWVFRRLWRLASLGCWVNEGRVIASSATLADPIDHMHNLMDRSVVILIDRSGAASAAKTWIVAPYSPQNLITAVSAQIKNNAQTLVYANTRATVENLAQQLSGVFPTVRIEPYRSGYSQDVRERIESELRDGTLRVVVATSALATGIDIGGLDTVVMADVPPDPSILRQIAGRAGRRGQEATIILLPNKKTPIGGLLLNEGGLTQLLNRTAAASAEVHNPVILERQLLLMASELPLTPATTPLMTDLPVRYAIRKLAASKDLVLKADGYHVVGKAVTPHSLLMQASGGIPLECDGKVIDTISMERAITQYAPGILVAYRGRQYRTEWHRVKSTRPGTYSDAITLRELTDSERLRIAQTKPSIQRTVSYIDSVAHESAYAIIRGNVVVTTRSEQLTLVSPSGETSTAIYAHPLSASYVTCALSVQLRAPVDHGFVHAILIEAEETLGVTQAEVGEWHTATQILFYDRDGERGAIDILAAHIDHLLRAARNRISSCACKDGCLNCIIAMTCKTDASKSLATYGLFAVSDHSEVVIQPVPKANDDSPRRSRR